MEKQYTAEAGDKTISIKSGKIAKQASGAVIVQQGETIVMVSAVASKDASANQSFLPLTVEYQEKIYSAGRIPGNYFRREMGRPSDREVLTCRLIDRPIRPLFPKGFFCEIQVIATVLSMDKENEPDVLAMLGASAALSISDIPFEGPIASVRVARVGGEFMINPTISEAAESDINIVLAGSKTGVIMVEGEGGEASEAEMIDAIFYGHEMMQPLIEMQEKLVADLGKEKRVVTPPEVDEELVSLIESKMSDKIREGVQVKDKVARGNHLRELKIQLREELAESHPDRESEIGAIFDATLKSVSRDIVLTSGKRIDGRAFDEIRDIHCETTLLPRTHGSALFTRGETQVMGILTLGSDFDEQRVETLAGDTTKKFMLHYNFPPYSVGECRRAGGPSRRDIGHGELATRAIAHVLPSKEEFDYTIRLVGEVMESNGSSSMGTVCSGIMALMDGGVPIKAPVSGIAMGLVSDGDNIAILSDILGDEDHTGDMDFKVAGTKEGITALQMDIKIKELSKEIMEKALGQAKQGRLHILDKMLKNIDKSRDVISPYAPKVVTTKVKSDKIRDIIGPGGKTIKGIQSQTGARIEINDEGIVKISAETNEMAEEALAIVTEIGTDPEVGAVYEGTVAKTTDFGAFVTIKSGTDGLVHISELANYRVKRVNDIVNEGDVVKVKVLEVSRDGRIRLSMKALEEK